MTPELSAAAMALAEATVQYYYCRADLVEATEREAAAERKVERCRLTLNNLASKDYSGEQYE